MELLVGNFIQAGVCLLVCPHLYILFLHPSNVSRAGQEEVTEWDIDPQVEEILKLEFKNANPFTII